MEAINWIKNNKNKSCFASNFFGDKSNILKFVKKLYKLGATNVEIDNIYDEPWRIKEEGGPYADTLIITLPTQKSKRLDLQSAIYDASPDELTEIDWNKDKTIVLWWD